MKKKISIIGASLYGCLLAYHLSQKKYEVTIYEKSSKLLSGFDSIDIKNYRINNGFHGLEYPRNKELINFLKNKIKLNQKRILNTRKLLINREIIDYTTRFKNLPKKIQDLYIKKNLIYYKNQNINFFFKKNFLKKIKKNSLRFSDDLKLSQHLFIPWFLPADVKHITSDEGHRFRSLIRNRKITPFYFIPSSGLFETISKHFLKEFKKQKVKIIFNSRYMIDGSEVAIKNKYGKDELKDIKNTKIIYCGSPIIFINHIRPKMLNELKKYRRYFFNILVRIPKSNKLPYFSELLCLNSNIYYVNRISRALHLENKKNYFIQMEIILKNSVLTNKILDKTYKELIKIFGFKNQKIIGYKFSRVIYSPTKKWLNKATNILKKFIDCKKIEVDNYNFEPINTAKVWLLLKKKLKKIN